VLTQCHQAACGATTLCRWASIGLCMCSAKRTYQRHPLTGGVMLAWALHTCQPKRHPILQPLPMQWQRLRCLVAASAAVTADAGAASVFTWCCAGWLASVTLV
jgi:hypothetical protein